MTAIADLESACTFLFVPGDDPRKLASAERAGADAVVVDLEDGVAETQKSTARRELERFVASRSVSDSLLLARLNAQGSFHLADDLRCVLDLPLDGLFLPKAHAEAIDSLDVTGTPLIAMIEDATGVRGAYNIGCDPRVARLALGGVDLAAELGLSVAPDGLQLLHVRSRLVIDSTAAGLAPPIDTPFLRYGDDDGLVSDCQSSRSLGFTAKACIHPAQVPIVRRVYAPTPEDLAWAAEVIETYDRATDAGRGVASVSGEMIDLPVVRRAHALLARNAKSEGST